MTIIGIDMFNLITQEHRMIRDAVQKLFTSLQAQDTERRQLDKVRIDGATVGRALGELGLFDTEADELAMTSAQVQASVAIESGAALHHDGQCWGYPDIVERELFTARLSVVTRRASERCRPIGSLCSSG
jgi:hypothetical protein